MKRWECPKCHHVTPWHRSHTKAAHRCNPAIPRITPMALIDDEGRK